MNEDGKDGHVQHTWTSGETDRLPDRRSSRLREVERRGTVNREKQRRNAIITRQSVTFKVTELTDDHPEQKHGNINERRWKRRRHAAHLDVSRDRQTSRQTIIQTSMALMQDTRGSVARAPPLMVVIVRTVSRPMETRAGDASTLIQNETQDRMTIRTLGTQTWIRKNPTFRRRIK